MKTHKNVRYQLIKGLFNRGGLTWDEAIEALISMCHMRPYQALECMAEDFDRRQAIVVRRAA